MMAVSRYAITAVALSALVAVVSVVAVVLRHGAAPAPHVERQALASEVEVIYGKDDAMAADIVAKKEAIKESLHEKGIDRPGTYIRQRTAEQVITPE